MACVGTGTFRYIAGPGEDFGDVARGLKAAIDAGNVAGVSTRVTQDERRNLDPVDRQRQRNASTLSVARPRPRAVSRRAVSSVCRASM